MDHSVDVLTNRHARRAAMAGGNDLPDGCDPAFDTTQAGAYTGLAAAYLEKLRSVGGGPRFVKYGRRAVRYRKADLDAWMAAHTIGSTSEAA